MEEGLFSTLQTRCWLLLTLLVMVSSRHGFTLVRVIFTIILLPLGHSLARIAQRQG